jgi:hypothetical protein
VDDSVRIMSIMLTSTLMMDKIEKVLRKFWL